MRKGEVWWAELEPPAGRRPVLLLSSDAAYAIRSLITVAPITTRIRHIISEVPLGIENGMPRNCVANMDAITTIPKDCLRNRLTSLSLDKLRSVEVAIKFALGLG